MRKGTLHTATGVEQFQRHFTSGRLNPWDHWGKVAQIAALRSAFLHEVIRASGEVGPGAIRQAARAHFEPPVLDRAAGQPRRDRKITGNN